jgi:hypothetical protein
MAVAELRTTVSLVRTSLEDSPSDKVQVVLITMNCLRNQVNKQKGT